MYNGKPLTLQLDHIDGNPINNNLENLRFLCPNCHSQTDTFAGKNPSKLLNCEGCGKIINVKNKHGMCQNAILIQSYFQIILVVENIKGIRNLKLLKKN